MDTISKWYGKSDVSELNQIYVISLEMHGRFRGEPEINPPKPIYQDMRDSSSVWRTERRVFHPVNASQMASNSFKPGDKVRLRLTTSTSRDYFDLTVLNISDYNNAKTFLGSYNASDSFNGEKFTHVLILSV